MFVDENLLYEYFKIILSKEYKDYYVDSVYINGFDEKFIRLRNKIEGTSISIEIEDDDIRSFLQLKRTMKLNIILNDNE